MARRPSLLDGVSVPRLHRPAAPRPSILLLHSLHTRLLKKGFSQPAALSVISPAGGELKVSSQFFSQGVESRVTQNCTHLRFLNTLLGHRICAAITLQLGPFVTPKLSAYSLTRNGPTPTALEVCGFNADSYGNPDASQAGTVRDVLRSFGAIVIIPRAPLKPGHYTVSITTDRTYFWDFAIDS